MENKSKKAVFKIGVIVTLVTTIYLTSSPVEAYTTKGEVLIAQTATLLDSVTSFFSSLFGKKEQAPSATTAAVVTTPQLITQPEKKTYSTYTLPPVATEPIKRSVNTSSSYAPVTTKTVTNTVYVPVQQPAAVQSNGITQAELEARLQQFASSVPPTVNTTCYISSGTAASSFYGGVSQSDVQSVQNSVTNLQTCITKVASVPGNSFNQTLNTTSSPTFANVTASVFCGDGSHLTGVSSFSTSTTRSIFSASSPLSYNASTGVFGTASGYSIPLTASSTNWNSFYKTPSTRITAGTNLQWSGNTLNVCGIAAGLTNNAIGQCSIALGCGSTASDYCSSVVGYCNNVAGGYCLSSIFGACNSTNGSYDTALGVGNCADSFFTNYPASTVGGFNYAFGALSSAFGNCNYASGYNSSSAFGSNNIACCTGSSAFGHQNTASGYNSSSAFGSNNIACCTGSSAFGYQNTASGYNSSAFGYQNTASGYNSSAFGYQNIASGYNSSASGYSNNAGGYHSFASGYRNTASGAYSSAFGTSLTNTVACSAQFGGVYGSTNAYMAIGATTGVNFCVSGTISQNGGAPSFASDRNLKENFTDVDKQSILNKINALPMQQWNYKSQDSNMTHIAPIAQDFYAAFNLNNSTTSISAIDPAGIALVGIQALSQRLDQLTGSSSFAQLAVSTSSLTSEGSSSVLTTLQSFGAEVVNGVAYLKEVFVEKLHVGSLEIKNPTDVHKSGYTIYDRATGQPICVYFENNVQKTSVGNCDDEKVSVTQLPVITPPVSINTPPLNMSTTTSSSTSTSTASTTPTETSSSTNETSSSTTSTSASSN